MADLVERLAPDELWLLVLLGQDAAMDQPATISWKYAAASSALKTCPW
ncbi:hypothetical protein [Streptomyces sp. UH6]|nr:hypothetical protein [Streptomyces sp. UH6]NYV75788.1 hypothetical protein [Streptomyces sp. UH6]